MYRTPLQLERTDEQDFEAEAYQPKALMPFMKRVPAKRVVHLPEAARDPVEFSLSFNESLPLPQGISSTQLANYHVTGMPLERLIPTLVRQVQVHSCAGIQHGWTPCAALKQCTTGRAAFWPGNSSALPYTQAPESMIVAEVTLWKRSSPKGGPEQSEGRT